jgi:hypothetical protein
MIYISFLQNCINRINHFNFLDWLHLREHALQLVRLKRKEKLEKLHLEIVDSCLSLMGNRQHGVSRKLAGSHKNKKKLIEYMHWL